MAKPGRSSPNFRGFIRSTTPKANAVGWAAKNRVNLNKVDSPSPIMNTVFMHWLKETLKVQVGGSWVVKPVKVLLSSSWVSKTIKIFR